MPIADARNSGRRGYGRFVAPWANWNYRPRAGIQARQQDFPLAAIHPGACLYVSPIATTKDASIRTKAQSESPAEAEPVQEAESFTACGARAETGEAEAAGSGHKILDGTGDERLVGGRQRGNTRSDVDRHARDIVGQCNEAPTRTSTVSLGPAVVQSLYVRLVSHDTQSSQAQ